MPYKKDGKEPAHEVVIAEIRKEVATLQSLLLERTGEKISPYSYRCHEAELESLLKLLDRVIIPEKHVGWVHKQLVDISGVFSMDEADKIFGDLDRFAPPPAEKPAEPPPELVAGKALINGVPYSVLQIGAEDLTPGETPLD